MSTVIQVKKHEYGLKFRYGDFVGLLEPGRYRFWSRLWSRQRDAVEVVDTLDVRFTHPLLSVLIRDEAVRARVEIVDLPQEKRAVVWVDGRLHEFLGPGLHVFWKQPKPMTIEVFDVSALRFEHAQRDTIVAMEDSRAHLMPVEIQPWEEGFLLVDGRITEKLTTGRHAFWRSSRNLACVKADLRETSSEVSGQEIMTKDRVTLRLNLHVTWRVVDVEAAARSVADYAQTVYREAQLALRAAVGNRTLDELLAAKESLGDEVAFVIAPRVRPFGVAVRSVGVRDVILPGEMKTILNQVIEAERRAQANLIRRREETAAARSQANTAKLLAENPILARMKELETLQEILAGAKTTFVLGEGDLLGRFRSLIAPPE